MGNYKTFTYISTNCSFEHGKKLCGGDNNKEGVANLPLLFHQISLTSDKRQIYVRIGYFISRASKKKLKNKN